VVEDSAGEAGALNDTSGNGSSSYGGSGGSAGCGGSNEGRSSIASSLGGSSCGDCSGGSSGSISPAEGCGKCNSVDDYHSNECPSHKSQTGVIGLDAAANALSATRGNLEKKLAQKQAHDDAGVANKCSLTTTGNETKQTLDTQCVDDNSTLASVICLLAPATSDYEVPKKKPRPPTSTDVVATDGSSSAREGGTVEAIRPPPSTDVVVNDGSTSSRGSISAGVRGAVEGTSGSDGLSRGGSGGSLSRGGGTGCGGLRTTGSTSDLIAKTSVGDVGIENHAMMTQSSPIPTTVSLL
jgi:hypothetical protein